MMAHRKPRPVRQNLLSEENAEAVDGLMDESEALEAKQAMKAHSRKFGKSNEDGEALATGGAVHGSGAGSSGAAPFTSKVVPQKAYTSEEARRMLPDGKGVWIGLHTDHAWQAKYPAKKDPPRSHTNTWDVHDAEVSHFRCLVRCLRWVWAAHQETTGQACPWDFPDPDSIGK